MVISIRCLRAGDDVVELTILLHRACAPLAAMGLRYTATRPIPEVTAQRLARRSRFIAGVDRRAVGTLKVHQSNEEPFPDIECLRKESKRLLGLLDASSGISSR